MAASLRQVGGEKVPSEAGLIPQRSENDSSFSRLNQSISFYLFSDNQTRLKIVLEREGKRELEIIRF